MSTETGRPRSWVPNVTASDENLTVLSAYKEAADWSTLRISDDLVGGGTVASAFRKVDGVYFAEFVIKRPHMKETRRCWRLEPSSHPRYSHIRVLRITRWDAPAAYAQFTRSGEVVFRGSSHDLTDECFVYADNVLREYATDIMNSDLLYFRRDIIRLLRDTDLPAYHGATAGSLWFKYEEEGFFGICTIYGAFARLEDDAWQYAYDEKGKFIEYGK